ncbi:hypothetical protein QBC40DRAFT_278180 [Triangularia verruculosa]|uniref:Uncharacterized protein n=1 Tax=Triangularia verruculosa TaxID=2587418 RepID=A0AAN6XJ51_9PEZI|nr:hypothetical protein QBC40DRAFT_278180 [Triangularia verruculosa]
MATRRNHLEDIPPPPYSETDIYSTTSGPSPTNPTAPSSAHFRRNSSNSDDTSTTADGDIIYTPPLTPQSARSNTVDFVPAPPLAPAISSTSPERAVTTPEAQVYFDSRPFSGIAVGNPTTVEITLANDPAQTDVETIAGIDRLSVGSGNGNITREDWMTFVNYLLPGFVTRTNERIVDRKLRAEGIESAGSEKGDDRSDRSQAEVLLDRIRSPVGSDDGEGAEARRERVGRTVREWNEGFFERRGVRVAVRYQRDDEQREERMPGGWEERFDATQSNQTQAQTQSQGQGQQQQQQQQQRGQGWMGRFSPFGVSGNAGSSNSNNSGNGFNFGGIKVDGERISIGDNFVVDGRTGHLKIGGIVADTNGISINGWSPGNMFGGRGGPHGRGGGPGAWCRPPPGPPTMPGMPCPPRWTWGGPGGRGACGGQRPERGQHHYFGRGGRGGWWSGRWAPGPTEQEQPEQRGQEGVQRSGNAQDANEPAAEDRGRAQQVSSKERRRSRSSSVSSTSSKASSSSESSVGSLPEYEELKDTQLPAMKAFLSEALHRPDEHITREKVRLAKQQLREAHRASATEINEPVNMTHDRKALRREVKELMREWKRLKKEQKRQRRQLRKEKRQRRKQERREKRQTRKEIRRAEKDFHRHGHRAGSPPVPPHGPPPPGPSPPPPHMAGMFPPYMPHMPHMPHMLSMPPMPPMPQIAQMAQMPQMPPMHPHGTPGPFSIPQSEGPPSYRGLSFGAPANGPSTPTGFPLGRPGPLPPGAWPQESDNTTPPESSAAKYKQADAIESQISAKYADLLTLQERISGPGFPKAEDEKAAIGLEKEIEDLAVEMERLRTEGDEEFARELAKEEESRHGLFLGARR